MKWKFKDEVAKRLAEEAQLRNNMREWLIEGQKVSEWLVPSRGVYNVHNRPSSRTLVAKGVVNPYAEHAFGVLTSGLIEGIAPTTRPWFSPSFDDPEMEASPELRMFMQQATKTFYKDLRKSNFYNQGHNYVREWAGFGTASMGVFDGGKESPYTFNVMTFGEFAIGTNVLGMVDRLYRTAYMNIHQLMDEYGDRLPDSLLTLIKDGSPKLDFWYTVIEGVVPEKYLDMPYTRFFILLGDEKGKRSEGGGGIYGKAPAENKYRDFLKVEGVSEFPYPTARWEVCGSDEMGVCPGMKAVPVIKRLQEVVKAGMVAYHRAVLPPLNAPIHLRGQVNNRPNSINYYSDPDQIVRPFQDIRFDHLAAERSEGVFVQALQEIFYNDVFLTASRDANASPLKARQVDEIASDRVIRIGPQLTRLFYEGFGPALSRAFQVGIRKGRFGKLPTSLQGKKLKIKVEFTSVLAQALKASGADPIKRYLQTMSGVAQFDQTAIDIINTDEVGYELADIEGVPTTITNDRNVVKQIREQRAQQQRAQMQQEQEATDIAKAQATSEVDVNRANVAETMSQAGANLSDNFDGGYVI